MIIQGSAFCDAAIDAMVPKFEIVFVRIRRAAVIVLLPLTFMYLS